MLKHYSKAVAEKRKWLDKPVRRVQNIVGIVSSAAPVRSGGQGGPNGTDFGTDCFEKLLISDIV